jgi:hypothetical protein
MANFILSCDLVTAQEGKHVQISGVGGTHCTQKKRSVLEWKNGDKTAITPRRVSSVERFRYMLFRSGMEIVIEKKILEEDATFIGFCYFFAFPEPETRDKAAGPGKWSAMLATRFYSNSLFHLARYRSRKVESSYIRNTRSCTNLNQWLTCGESHDLSISLCYLIVFDGRCSSIENQTIMPRIIYLVKILNWELSVN